ncbi:sodium-coupled neutral amino acid transporter 2 [Elysia marginata]|uniref:Sodium-coupled neutral amino acid transporter 2 n=1 Tax=Elysia marginata TaxID=1093978 RepID=A0AAV4FM72_9GAST|nr:sodium-coupled neutral amino acid transporter 2 [Elysia marginata]
MAGHNNWPYIVNLGNSIIGVAVLAMPFCFKQCGILLGMIVLLFCTWLTLISCQLLMRAGIHSRRRSYEFLAYHTHGATGKLISELGMIGMQVGTLIAQIVVIGDLGPAIFSKFLGIENTSGLRTFLILALCLGVGLPLGLLKDLKAVSRASTVCISFYCIFILYVITLSMPNIRSGEWYQKVSFWRPEGFFQCLPILSFSFGCQTQLFLLYDALPDPSLKAISGVISSAVNLCAVAYLLVGFFGYVAFHDIEVPGDVISVFPNTFFADLMKGCFVFSIVITFPVIIFPCRSSIYTLLFAKKSKAHDDVINADNYLPEKLFKGITIVIVISCMILGILIPNVEFVLGINGAIMGTLICYIFPAMFFLKVMGNKQDSRGMAQIVLCLGVTILLLSTFATLSSQGKGDHHARPVQPEDLAGVPMLPRDVVDGALPDPGKVPEQLVKPVETQDLFQKENGKVEVIVKDDTRQEPPNPDPPDDVPPGGVLEKVKEAVQESKIEAKKEPPQKDSPVVIESPADKKDDKKDDNKVINEIKVVEDIAKAADANKAKELELQEKEKKQDQLLQQLEKHREEQEKLIEEQRQLLKEFKDHHEKDIKNELDQEKEKFQQQLKQDVGHGGNLQNAQPVRVQGDNIQHVHPGGIQPEPLPAQKDSVGLKPVGKAQQIQANLQQQQLVAQKQQQQQQLPLDNLQERRADVDPQLQAAFVKSDSKIAPDMKNKKPQNPENIEPRPAAGAGNLGQQQPLRQQNQEIHEADSHRQENLNSVKNIAHAKNQQQPLLKESDLLNGPNHPRQPESLGGAGHVGEPAKSGRVKRSVENEIKTVGDSGAIDQVEMENDRAERAALVNKQKDKSAKQDGTIVKMDVESAPNNDEPGRNQQESKLDNDKPYFEKSNASEPGKDVKESPVAGRESEIVGDKKRNEEMRRRLKSLNSDQNLGLLEEEFIQSFSNDIKGVASRQLLHERSRD